MNSDMNSSFLQKNNRESKRAMPSAGSIQQNRNGINKRKDKEDPAGKKQRVFINKTANLTPIKSGINSYFSPLMRHLSAQPTTSSANFFGPSIPDNVMENVLFRFLYNIPENEKQDNIRICFHIEQAHWFYLDFYCSSIGNIIPTEIFGDFGGDNTPQTSAATRMDLLENCKKVGFPQFARQVFFNCDYLEKWRPHVDRIVEEFRHYKSNVPTYGVVMLDSTLNYILLVQGYYASKNSWGFPKGKINEGELPLECAIRESLEEVGFDVKDHIVQKERPIQCFIGETLVRLYLAMDVPMDFQFKPHLRKEIRKIAWFSVWDLPKDKNDEKGCARLGMNPNNFYGILPFINKICEFIHREQADRNKPKQSVLKHEGQSESSAFQPVIPRASSQKNISSLGTPNMTSSAQNLHLLTMASSSNALELDDVSFGPFSQQQQKFAIENLNLFKPLKVEPENQPPISFTGQSFLEEFLRKSTPAVGIGSNNEGGDETTKEQTIVLPKNPAGVIGSESRRRNKEIKQPKPLPHPSALIINMYEAPAEEGAGAAQQQAESRTSPQKRGPAGKVAKVSATGAQTQGSGQPQQQQTMTTAMAIEQPDGGDGKNEIVNMLRSSFGKKEQLVVIQQTPKGERRQLQREQKQQQKQRELVPTQVRLCEAWKKFTLDTTCLKSLYTAY